MQGTGDVAMVGDSDEAGDAAASSPAANDVAARNSAADHVLDTVAVGDVRGMPEWAVHSLFALLRSAAMSPAAVASVPPKLVALALGTGTCGGGHVATHEAGVLLAGESASAVASLGLAAVLFRAGDADPLPAVMLPAPHVAALRLSQALLDIAHRDSRRFQVAFASLVSWTIIQCAQAMHVWHTLRDGGSASSAAQEAHARQALLRLIFLVGDVHVELDRCVLRGSSPPPALRCRLPSVTDPAAAQARARQAPPVVPHRCAGATKRACGARHPRATRPPGRHRHPNP